MLTEIYQAVLYQPLYNLLVFFYNIVPGHDLGLAIILLTILIRLILSPFFVQSIKAQRALQRVQPKLDELKEKYKGNQEKLGPAIMELYKKEKVSPFSSCFPLLIQMPILIAIFQVFRLGLGQVNGEMLYSFMYNPGNLDAVSFGFMNLAEKSIWLAVLAGLAQFWQSKTMLGKKQNQPAAKSPLASAMGKQMTYFMPIITVMIGSSLPGGLTFYWFLTTLLSAIQQSFIFKKMDKTAISVK